MADVQELRAEWAGAQDGWLNADKLADWARKHGAALLDAPEARDAAEARVVKLEAALTWYERRVSDCRKIHSEGEQARYDLDADRGDRARQALKEVGDVE